MGILRINDTGPLTNGSGLLGNHMQNEHKQIRNGVKEHDCSQENESRANRELEDVNDGKTEVVRVQSNGQAIQQRSEKLPTGPMVHWERFLPLRSLKVLLVENDDSTRHIVSALLRNCGYEVTAVSNGLQGWKILEDLTNHIDLVLTEVVTPVMSGLGLLRVMMNHKSRNNIPVIMMSSHDSMSIVFKCLSKGAVDFLVKPIRKNELKNLWQHVWRKWHSSSGSGSESGVRTQKSIESKSVQESGNNYDNINEDDHGSVGVNARGGSDNGSATQSSWTKRVEEIDSPRAVSSCSLLANPANSTCAQVIHSKPEAFDNSWIPLNAKRYYGGQDDELDNAAMGKDLEIGAPTGRNIQLKVPTEKVPADTGVATKDKSSATNSEKDEEKQETIVLGLSSEKGSDDLSNQAADLIGAIANNGDPRVESPAFVIPSGLSKVSDLKNKNICGTEEIPSLELSLKRVRDVGDNTGTVSHGRNVLRHTDLSAFSRYNSGATANQAPTGNVGSCSPLDNSSDAAKTDSMKNLQSNSNSMPPNQRSNGSSNNNDMGSTTNNALSKPTALCDNLTPKSSIKILNSSSAFQLVQNGHASAPQPTPETSDAAKPNMVLVQVKGVNQQVQVQHHHHHYHHHHHHVHKTAKNQQQSNQDDLSLQTMTEAGPQCGSSNLLAGSLHEGNSGNTNLNESASWSNHGSNGQNGSGNVSNAIVVNIESDNGVPENGKGTSGIGIWESSGNDQNRSSQREAALNKFRQKRKERCFTKKVRYHSRKKLAEQRPRVRGQFVRQVSENNGRDTHC